MSKQHIIAIDFDGTIVEDRFPEVGNLIPGAREAIKQLYMEGYYIIIWTCRSGSHLDDCVRTLRAEGIPYHSVNEACPANVAEYGSDTRKVYADIYIDDKSLFSIFDLEAARNKVWNYIFDSITRIYPNEK